MTLALMVAGRQSGTFGTFEVEDGNVSKNRRLVLSYFNETTALVPMDARLTFTTGEEHSAFDATLMALSTTGVTIQYVESIGEFMNPKARFKEWLGGKATILPDLTPEELAVPSAYESAKAKFVAMFTPPVPSISSGGIDLVAAFGPERAVTADMWRKCQLQDLPADLVASGPMQRTKGLLRIRKTGGNSYVVENGRGDKVNRTRFLAMYHETIKPIWDRTAPNGEIGRLTTSRIEGTAYNNYHSSRHSVVVYNNYVEVGCQSIPRAEIERIVTEFEKLGITK